MANNTHPLPTDGAAAPTVDHAALIAQAQTQLDGTARQVKAVALELTDGKLSPGLLRAYDAIRRQSLILSTFVQDLQNEQTRQALESGADLPPDVAPPPLFGNATPPDATASPSASQGSTPYRPGGFLQEP